MLEKIPISLYILIFFLGFGSKALSQDTIIYKNGNIIALKILSVSEQNSLIKGEIGENLLTISMQAIIRYKYQNIWTNVDVKKHSVPTYEVEIPKYKTLINERNGFSIGMNIASLTYGLISKITYVGAHSNKPIISIEPEFRFKKWSKASIKGSIEIGIPKTKFESLITSEIQYYGNHYYPILTEVSHYNKRRNIPFQSSISLKFWPKTFLVNRLYLHFGILAGIADYKAITIYDSYKTTVDPWNNQTILRYDHSHEVMNNRFLFVRTESGFGYHFHLSNKYSLNVELVYAKRVQNKGEIPDEIYRKIDNQDYTKIYSSTNLPNLYNSGIINNIFLRVKLFYHFQKK